MTCIVRRAGLTTSQFIPQCGVAGAGCIPGESPSRSPAICYRMWSDGSYPVLFKDVSQSQMKEAFCLWFQELGQTLPDGLVPEESDEDSECESSSEEDELYFDAESESESESEYASFSRSGPSAAARNSESSHPPPTSTGSPRAFFDVDSASSSSEASGEDDDEDEDWRFNMSEARAAGSQRLVGIGLLSKPSTVSPSSSRESTDDLSLAIPQGDDSKPEAPNDECDDASVDEWFYGIQPPSAEVQCPSTGYHATSLFDVLNEDGVQSPESRDDHDVRSSFALPESCFATSSHSSSHVPDGPYSGAAPGEEYTETSLSTDPNSAERPDGVAATASTDGLLPLESIIHWEKLLFTFDAAEDREPVQQAPASTIPSSVEVAQASTSSGRKRARESEDESEDAALAGPSKKVSYFKSYRLWSTLTGIHRERSKPSAKTRKKASTGAR